MANVILTNGARLYVDHAHPEYSGPEVTSALDAVRYDKAGDAVMAIAAQRASQASGDRSAVQEQHRRQGRLVRHPRELPDAAQHPVRPDRHPVHRVPGHPAGDHRAAGSASASRASSRVPDQPAGGLLRGRGRLETTLNRPIINTRDEPHADASRTAGCT
jgi:proteasome accessory factor A